MDTNKPHIYTQKLEQYFLHMYKENTHATDGPTIYVHTYVHIQYILKGNSTNTS